MRAPARGFEGAPNTGRGGLVEAAAPLQALSRSFLWDVHVRPGPLDAFYAVLRAVHDGQLGEEEARKRLARSPHWVWPALAPARKFLLALAGGERTLALAQHGGQHGAHVLAPAWAPRCLTDGCKASMPPLLAPDGQWGQPRRRQAPGPTPPPRWMPLPQGL